MAIPISKTLVVTISETASQVVFNVNDAGDVIGTINVNQTLTDENGEVIASYYLRTETVPVPANIRPLFHV